MLFYTNRAFRQARKKLMEKSKSRVWAIHQLMLHSYIASTEAIQRVFTACIQSIVLYAVEIWEVDTWFKKWGLPLSFPEKDKQEQVHRAYLQR